jgi:hypothetical protein
MEPGGRVLVGGLVSRPDLNGKHATLLAYNAATGRWSVEIDEEQVRIKTSNLTLEGSLPTLFVRIPFADIQMPLVYDTQGARLDAETKLLLYNSSFDELNKDKAASITYVCKKVTLEDVAKLQTNEIMSPMVFKLTDDVLEKIEAKKRETGLTICKLIGEPKTASGTCSFELTKMGPTNAMFERASSRIGRIGRINCVPNWSDDKNLRLPMVVDL